MPRQGTTTEQGYGYPHVRQRKHWAAHVATGQATCWRCGGWIDPQGPWDLGHDDHDRSVYRGPECRPCNRRAGGIKGNRSPLRRSVRAMTADRW
jgi:hypothetical protein